MAMGRIRVDLDQLRAASGKVRNYVQSAQRHMGDAGKRVNELRTAESYKGVDATVFYQRFNGLRAKDSAFSKMNRELMNYANYLDGAANCYRNAREEAIAWARRTLR